MIKVAPHNTVGLKWRAFCKTMQRPKLARKWYVLKTIKSSLWVIRESRREKSKKKNRYSSEKLARKVR